MKNTCLSILALLILSQAFGQANLAQPTTGRSPIKNLTVAPAIGLNPMPVSDLVLSNVVQWDAKKRLALVSRSAVVLNTAFARNFNYVHTNYSYILSETLGIGTSLYSKQSSFTFALMAGVKYEATRETLNNPDYEKVSMTSSTLSPDFGLMYHVKVGKKKYFFSYRMYIPLYPYPIKTTDIWSMDSNLANTSMEFGLGIRLK